jgi:hypothetical protein
MPKTYTFSYKAIKGTSKTVLILMFSNKTYMNDYLSDVSDTYEGHLGQIREGHNVPASVIPKTHTLYTLLKPDCVYVIGCYNSNSLQHELLHAQFYADSTYRDRIQNEWDALPSATQIHIIHFLKRLGYPDSVILDEYQAYRYTEKPNFFGIRIS